MARPPLQNTGSSSNPIVDTLVTEGHPGPTSGNSYNTFANNGNSVTVDIYRTQASDALTFASGGPSLESRILSDYGKLPTQSLAPANFSWNAELDNVLQSTSDVMNIKFNETSTVTPDTDMTFTESNAALTASSSGPLPGNPGVYPTGTTVPPISFFESQPIPIPGGQVVNSHIGEARFPGSVPIGSTFSAHVAVEGTDAMFQGATELGGAHRRDSNLGHEFGHALGLSHSHGTNGSGTTNGDFPAGFMLNDNKYTAMSYNWATTQGLDATGTMVQANTFGQNVGMMAIDIAALQHKAGISDNNTGNTTYNLTDGAQITDPKSNNAALDIDGADESRAELSQAYTDAAKTGGIWEGIKAYSATVSEQIKSSRFDGGEESIGRAYKTIYDGQREVDAVGKESIGNGGIDEISYAGSQQSAMINLNDAGLGADNTDAQYLDLQREIKGSGRWTEFNTEFQNEIDATANDATGTLRPDAYNAGGHFSKLYTTDAAGKVTATQDGGYSIANGSVIENATGGDKADTLIGNEHDNVLTGNKGADALYGGHGNDTLNGGDGNDALVAGRGNNVLDGGADFDTASYKNYYDPSIRVPITQGVSFSITGSQATVTKPLNGAIAGPAGASVETDSIQNVERFEGSDRDDVFTVENLSGNMYISGGAGNDTLTVKDPTGAYSLDMTGGTYPAGHPRVGESFTGTVSDGTNTIYLEDKDLNVTIDAPAPTPAPTPAPATEKSAELGLEDAIEILAADQKTLNQQVSETGVSTPAHEAINHPDAFQMIGNLHAAGVSTLKAKIQPDMDIEDRVGNILNAGRDATQEAGLLMPHEERARESEAELGADYAQPIAEPVYEDDYSYSM